MSENLSCVSEEVSNNTYTLTQEPWSYVLHPSWIKREPVLDQMFLDLDFQKVTLGHISSVPLVSEACKTLQNQMVILMILHVRF